MNEGSKAKLVYFIGIWQAQQVTDQLLRQISNQIASKKQFATTLQITAKELVLNILDRSGRVTRHDKVALENIVDFIDNKYSTTCTLAIARDKQQKLYKVFVFVCKSDRDAAELIHVFKATKRQMSGEGFNTNLTPKGKNWTLQQKNEPLKENSAPNRLVKVINTEKQNGGVTVIQTGDRHDSFSRQSDKSYGSDVKDELNQLAGEVRDIKRLLQGSKGRSQFEKHYGYRLVEMPITEDVPDQLIEIIEDDVVKQPETLKRETLYVKNSNYMRRLEAPTVYTVNRNREDITRSTKRHAHSSPAIVTSAPQTNAFHTKTMHASRNPILEYQHVRVQSPPPRPSKIFSRSFRPMIFSRARAPHTVKHGSDIVHKNIEDVYKSRSLRRIYLPFTPPNNQVAEYVNNQMVDRQRQQQQLVLENSMRNKHDQVRVFNTPEVRTFYENTQTEITNLSSSTNANYEKTVSVSLNGTSEEKQKQVKDMTVDKEEVNDQVFVVKAEKIKTTQNQTKLDDETNIHIAEDVYLAKDRSLQGDMEDVLDKEKEVASETGKYEQFVKAESTTKNIIDKVKKEESTPFQCQKNGNMGLFGAYVEKPDLDEQRDKISKEVAYRYHDDEAKNENTELKTNENVNHTEEKRVRYNENIEQIDNIADDDGDDDFKENDSDDNFDETYQKSDDEESYHLDVDALKSYTTDPDIVIVETNRSDVEHKIEEVSNGNFTEYEIHEITSKGEDTVLF